jgi:hypothetical protein
MRLLLDTHVHLWYADLKLPATFLAGRGGTLVRTDGMNLAPIRLPGPFAKYRLFRPRDKRNDRCACTILACSVSH